MTLEAVVENCDKASEWNNNNRREKDCWAKDKFEEDTHKRK